MRVKERRKAKEKEKHAVWLAEVGGRMRVGPGWLAL